jgi:hypothetical protein
MNKKMYFAPEMEEQLMEMEGFLCASKDPDSGDDITSDQPDSSEGDGWD